MLGAGLDVLVGAKHLLSRLIVVGDGKQWPTFFFMGFSFNSQGKNLTIKCIKEQFIKQTC